jgi:hypothetical protein
VVMMSVMASSYYWEDDTAPHSGPCRGPEET